MKLPSMSDAKLDLLHHEASTLALAKVGREASNEQLYKEFPRIYLREVMRILTQEVTNVL